MNIVVLTTDTLHHRYFLQRINKYYPIKMVIYETTSIKPKFNTFVNYQKKENIYEEKNFFIDFDNKRINVPSYFYKNINSNYVIKRLKKQNIDLGIIFGTRKVSKNIIDLFSDKLLNVHRGIVQRYRGLDSDLWAIYHSDFKNVGVTVHKVDENLDTGQIIKQRKLNLNSKVKIFQLRYKTTLLATNLMLEIIKKYRIKKKLIGKEFNPGKYYSFISTSKKKIAQSILENLSEKYK